MSHIDTVPSSVRIREHISSIPTNSHLLECKYKLYGDYQRLQWSISSIVDVVFPLSTLGHTTVQMSQPLQYNVGTAVGSWLGLRNWKRGNERTTTLHVHYFPNCPAAVEANSTNPTEPLFCPLKARPVKPVSHRLVRLSDGQHTEPGCRFRLLPTAHCPLPLPLPPNRPSRQRERGSIECNIACIIVAKTLRHIPIFRQELG